MTEEQLEFFIEAAEDFLRVNAHEAPETSESRIEFGEPPTRDYTGVIDVSGSASGVVYFTAGDEQLSLILTELGEDEPEDEELKADLIGEFAGTVVMNVREEFGADFGVSPPRVFGPSRKPELPDHVSFVTPMQWGGGEIDMVIALDFSAPEAK